MLKFLFNFVIFGLVFYLLHLYLPDAFNTLVGWADSTVAFGHDMFDKLMEQFNGGNGEMENTQTSLNTY